MLLEIAIVIVLILANGFLAMSELAIVSSRAARLRVLAEGGSTGARIALSLSEHPGRFLSTVQIGITLVGVLSGAFSGATLGVRLSDALIAAGANPSWADPVGVGAVVVVITYLSLIIGELVPKQIALRDPEATAARVAPVMKLLARLAAPLVWLLEISGRVVLLLIGKGGPTEGGMSDEEVKIMLAEARAEGLMYEAETEMIAGVMRVADRNASGLMTPRHEVEMVDLGDAVASIIDRFRTTRRTRLPVSDGSPDNIIGVLTSRDFLDPEAQPDRAQLAALVTPAPAVNEHLSAIDVIDELRNTPAHMLLVFDEYGHFEGIITAMDVLEAITGEFVDEAQPDGTPKVVEREDGSLLVAGWMPVDEFADQLGVTLPDDRDFETVAGLVLHEMGTLPDVGDKVTYESLKIEIVDMDGRRIDQILVTRS